jgi:hypothetical protein
MKVIAIEKAQDISKLEIKELIGSLQNFEIIINNRVEKKDNNALSTGIKETQGNSKNNEILAESVVLLGKLFNKIVSLENWKPITDGQNIRSNIRENQKDKGCKFKEDKCLECGGFGHITTECANLYIQQKKNMDVAYGSERISEGMFPRKVTALTGRVYSDH